VLCLPCLTIYFVCLCTILCFCNGFSRAPSPANFRFGQRLAFDSFDAAFNDIQPAQVCFKVHDHFVHQQDMRHFLAGIVAVPLPGGRVEFPEDVCPLGLNQSPGISFPGYEGDHHLDEEFISLVVGCTSSGEPFLKGGLSVFGDSVHATVGFFALAQVGGCFHQPSFFEPVEGGVNLGRFHFPGFMTHNGCENGVEFVPVTRFLGKETKNGVANRHKVLVGKVQVLV